MKRRAVSAVSVIAALAVAAPVAAPANAATPKAERLPALPALPALGGLGGLGGFGGLPAFDLPPLSFVGPQVAIGPTVIGSVFNGGTTVVTSTEPAQGNTIASP